MNVLSKNFDAMTRLRVLMQPRKFFIECTNLTDKVLSLKCFVLYASANDTILIVF